MAIESSVTAPLFFKICILYALSILSECAWYLQRQRARGSMELEKQCGG